MDMVRTQPETELEKAIADLKQLGNKPADKELARRIDGILDSLENEPQVNAPWVKQQLVSLEERTPVESKQEDLEEKQRNFQLALSRLVADNEERNFAWKYGAAFKKKYHLDNKQMAALAEVAVAAGEYKDTEPLRLWIRLFRLLPDKKIEDAGGTGSCSCCCP